MSPAKKKSAVELAAARLAETVEEGLSKLGPVLNDLKRHVEGMLSSLSRQPKAKAKRKAGGSAAKPSAKRKAKPSAALAKKASPRRKASAG